MRKENVEIFLKIFFISGLLTVLFLFGLLVWGMHGNYYHGHYIQVGKRLVLSNFSNLTERIDEFPSLKGSYQVIEIGECDITLKELAKKNDSDLRGLCHITFQRYNITAKEAAELEAFEYVKIGDTYYKPLVYRSIIMKKTDKTNAVNLSMYPEIESILVKSRSEVLSANELAIVKDLVSKKGSIVKFKGKYYRLVIDCRVYLKPECVEVGEELEKYPLLKRALITAEKKGKATITAPLDEWRSIAAFIKEKGYSIAYNGSCYGFGFQTV